MPATRTTYEDFADMPVGLRDFLLSDRFDAAIADLQKIHQLSKEQADTVSTNLIEAAFNDILLPEAVANIKKALVPATIADEKWPVFLADLLKSEVWPLRELYGDELTTILSEQKIATNC